MTHINVKINYSSDMETEATFEKFFVAFLMTMKNVLFTSL
jgi:hypothetical protein